MRRLLPLSLLLLVVAAAPALAAKVSVSAERAVLLSAPPPAPAVTLLEMPRHYPLEVLREEGGYLEVRDYKGRHGWVANSGIGRGAGVVVTAEEMEVRAGAGMEHPVVFVAKEGVSLEVIDVGLEWVAVRHVTGRAGWAPRNRLWGL